MLIAGPRARRKLDGPLLSSFRWNQNVDDPHVEITCQPIHQFRWRRAGAAAGGLQVTCEVQTMGDNELLVADIDEQGGVEDIPAE